MENDQNHSESQFSQEELKKLIWEKVMNSEEQTPDVLGDMFNEETFRDLKPIISKILDEIKNETYLYAKEDEKIIDGKNKATESIGQLLIINISSIRNFLLTLTSFSLVVTGAVLSILSSNSHDFIKIPLLAYISLVFLAICIITSIIYLLHIHMRENNQLSNILKFQKDAADKLHEFLIKNAENKKTFNYYITGRGPILEENRKKEKELLGKSDNKITKKDYWPHAISYSFLIGITAIALSLFQFQ